MEFMVSVLTIACLPLLLAVLNPDTYIKEEENWRAHRETRLKSDRGWLSVAGLMWLHEGHNSLGFEELCEVKLPGKYEDGIVGSLTLSDGHVFIKTHDKAGVSINGQPVPGTQQIKTDADGTPDHVTLGSLTFTIIKRGTRTGVRLYDANCPGRVNFTGLKWYEVNPQYRIEAKFVPYSPPKPISITNVLGDTEPSTSPGYLEFSINGHVCHLDTQGGDDGYFINFHDLTSGKTTYPAGRFLDTDKAKNGVVILDFNRAYNPPCAFTAYATCPLPPRTNFLSVEIPAGEKTYHAH